MLRSSASGCKLAQAALHTVAMPQPPYGKRVVAAVPRKLKMMRITVVAVGFALLAVPALAQAPDIGRMLQGLTTGNQNQDQSLREAYERGYRAGQQDSARQSDRRNRSPDDHGSSDRDRDDNQSYRRNPYER
jgi:hypothetical protein